MTLTACRALLVLALLALPGLASATPLTLTFDVGEYDPTMVEVPGEPHGPFDWLENGARIGGFWATDVGTAGGSFIQGHTHLLPGRPGVRDTGYKVGSHAWTDDLQGLVISLEDGGSFDLISLDYNIRQLELTGDPLQERLPWSYAVSDPHILTASSYDPTVTDFESEWTPHAASGSLRDWHTLTFTGLEDLTTLMFTNTAHNVWVDNIVIDVHDMAPIPEPSTALLLGLGLGVLATRRRSASLLG